MSAAAWLFGGLALALVWGHLTTAAQLWTAERPQRAARRRLRQSVKHWRAVRDGEAQRPVEAGRTPAVQVPVPVRAPLQVG